MHNASVLACVLEEMCCVCVCVRGCACVNRCRALWRVARWKKKIKKKREAIICYAGLTLKQGISGKL